MTVKTLRGVLILVAGVLGGTETSHAQVFKCKGADGRVTYTQGGCGSSEDAKVVAPSFPRADAAEIGYRGGAQPGGSPAERELSNLIAAALARDDYRKAESLAVNAEHWRLIADARAAKSARAASAAANRPRVCTYSGYNHPGGSSSGFSVCR